MNEFDLLLNLELEKNISVEENWGKFKKKLVKYDKIRQIHSSKDRIAPIIRIVESKDDMPKV